MFNKRTSNKKKAVKPDKIVLLKGECAPFNGILLSEQKAKEIRVRLKYGEIAESTLSAYKVLLKDLLEIRQPKKNKVKCAKKR